MRTKLYLSYNDLLKCKEIQRKNHVSLSTLVDVIFNSRLFAFIIVYEADIHSKYIDQSQKQETTIILKKENETFLKSYPIKSYTQTLSNLIHIYLHLDKNKNIFSKYLEQGQDLNEQINIIKRDIGNELAKKREIYWNYNEQLRNIYRAKKQLEKEQK